MAGSLETDAPNHGPAHGPAVALTIGGRSLWLPPAAVRDITLVPRASPLPLAPPWCAGLVLHQGRIVPQLDLARTWGETAGDGRFALIVTTDQGPVQLRVDQVAPGGDHEGAPGPWLLDQLAPLLADWSAAQAPTPGADPLLPEEAGAEPLALLVVRCQGRPLALPAAAVARVARPQRCWQPVATEGIALVAVIEGEIMAARWLTPQAVPDAEAALSAWGLVTGAGDQRQGLLVDAVDGLALAEPAELHGLGQGSRRSLWWLAPDQGEIEIILPPGCALPPQAARLTAAAEPQTLGTAGSGAAEGGLGGLGLALGDLTLALPTALAGQVLPLAPQTLRPVRHGRALPLVDLTPLFPHAAPARRAVALTRGGRARLALAGGEVIGLEPDLAWQPLPTLPPPLAALVDAVAADGQTGLLLRLRPDLLSRPLAPALARHLPGLRRGWLPLTAADAT